MLRRRAVLSFLAVAVAVGAGPAGAAPAAAGNYSQRQVVLAFRDAKIKLRSATYGKLQPVASLTEISVPRTRKWTVAAYVYRTPGLASRSYAVNVKAWRRSGFASTRLKNIVVVSVPKGRVLGKKAKPFPMPAQVRTALAALAR